MTTQRRCWPYFAAALAGGLLLYFTLAWVADRQDERGERILYPLDPVFQVVREDGRASMEWLAGHADGVAWTITGLGAALALLAVIFGRRRALPVALWSAATVLAAWGQVSLFHDRIATGSAFYAGGVLCALALGIVYPLTRVPGAPPLDCLHPQPPQEPPAPPDAQPAAQTPPAATGTDIDTTAEGSAAPAPDGAAGSASRWPVLCGGEVLLFCAILIGALLLRLYALLELPCHFDAETITQMIRSWSMRGFAGYLRVDLLSNNSGVLHPLTQYVLYQLYGPSILAVRLTAVFWGTASVALIYWAMRRLAGRAPAIAAGILYACAPDQLFWSRNENVFYVLAPFLGLTTALLGLWMIRRFSPWAALCATLWMPAARYFYSPCMVMAGFPVLVYVHALVFVRGAWRKAWYMVPLLAAGTAASLLSLSVLFYGLNGGPWRFVHPAQVHGAAVWHKHGEPRFRKAAPTELAFLQGRLIANNLAYVAKSMVYHFEHPTHWYERECVGRITTVPPGIAVLFALGLAYVLGQCYDRRAGLLLIWVGLALLPACMSNHAAPRRFALLFPALYLLTVLWVFVGLRLLGDRGHRRIQRIAAPVWAAAIAGLAWAGLASHFSLRMGTLPEIQEARFSRPLFQSCDAVYTNMLDGRFRTLFFSNLERIVSHETFACDWLEGNDWPRAALDPVCDFPVEAYGENWTPGELAERRRRYDPRRIGFLLQVRPDSAGSIALLEALYPDAEVRRSEPDPNLVPLVAFAIGAEQMRALRRPRLELPFAEEQSAPLVHGGLLSSVTLEYSFVRDGTAAVVRGGLLLPEAGWYQLAPAPACDAIAARVSGRPLPFAEAIPLTAGVHPFTLELRNLAACPLPVTLTLQDWRTGRTAPIPPEWFTGPQPLNLPLVAAPPVEICAGYAAGTPLVALPGQPIEFGIDRDGGVRALCLVEDQWRLVATNPDGTPRGEWPVDLPPDPGLNIPLAVADDGATYLVWGDRVLAFEADGRPADVRNLPPGYGEPTELAFCPDGRLAAASPHRRSLVLLERDGRVAGELRTWQGGPGAFAAPAGVAANASGALAVIEQDGTVYVFQLDGSSWPPHYVRTFRAQLDHSPADVRGADLAADGVLILTQRPEGAPREYTLAGARRMAASPGRDLSNLGHTLVPRVCANGDAVLLLDLQRRRIYRLQR